MSFTGEQSVGETISGCNRRGSTHVAGDKLRGNYCVADTREYKKTTIPAPTSGIPTSAKTRKDVGCVQRSAVISTMSPRSTSAAEICPRRSITWEGVMALLSRTSRFQDERRCEPYRGT